MPTLTLRSDKDAYVAENAPDNNFGAVATLLVESKVLLVAANKRLLCSFDLAGLPAGVVRVVQATLRLKPSAMARGRNLRCHHVTGAWSERAVTWNTQPGVGTDHGTRRSEELTQEWDVTTSVVAATPTGRVEFRIKDDAEGALVGQQQEYPSREGTGQGPELVVQYEVLRSAAVASSVRPRYARMAFIPATLDVAVWRQAHLGATVAPRVSRAASLAATCSVARPPPDPSAARARAAAEAAARDFAALCEAVGSTLVIGTGPGARTLRRVVQVVETRTTESFPRTVTSEAGVPSRQDVLRRGDAILYAQAGDQLPPGTELRWQGRSWTVVGSLGAEMLGDTTVYCEVGLRRLSVTAAARVEGDVVVPRVPITDDGA